MLNAGKALPFLALAVLLPVVAVVAARPAQAQAPNALPVFAENSYSRSVSETASVGSNVGLPITADDADQDTLSYALSETNSEHFSVSATGQITVASALDYETTPSYSLTITASDGNGATDTATVSIKVVDIVITVGSSGDLYGYDSGSYGSLDGGSFPGALFGDGNSRTVAQVYEDADGYWYFTYSDGATGDWNDNQERLDEILVEVIYEDGRDSREFVLGGFIDSRPGTRGLKLDPPLPSRDWASRNTQEVAITLRPHVSQPLPAVLVPLTEPTSASGSFVEFLVETTPGGPVVAQMLIVILVYVGYLFKTPKTATGVMMAAVVLIMTPWIPTFWGQGSTMAASIVLVDVVAGAYVHKAFLARTEE